MMQCQTPGCRGLSGAICTGAGQWIQFCPICKTKQAIQPPRQPDEADGLAVRALVDLQRFNYATAEQGFLAAAGKAAQDAPRQAFYLWCSLIARYGVEFVHEILYPTIPTRRANLFVPTFGRFPLPDHRIMDTDACRQLDTLLFGMPGVDVEAHLQELDVLIQEIGDCLSDRRNQYNVFIAWHDQKDDGTGPCRTFADRLNSYLNTQRDCYSFVSFRALNDVVVDHYEPHIYTALASAKVMVIVVDDLDAMQRKFLRSEINRFLIRRAANHKLHIYLCCMQGATGTPPTMMAGWQRRNGCENTDIWYELVTKDVMERLRDDAPAPGPGPQPVPEPQPVPKPEPPKPEPVPQPQPVPEPQPVPTSEPVQPEPTQEAEQKKQKKIDWKNVFTTAFKVLKPIVSNFFVKTNNVTGKKGPTKRGLLSSITAILLCISQVLSGVVMPDENGGGQGFSALVGWVKQGWVSVFGEKGEDVEEGNKGGDSSDKTVIPSRISYSLSNDHKEIVVTIPKHTDSSIKSYSLYRTVGNTTARELLRTFNSSSNLTYKDKDLEPGKSYTYFYIIECKDGSKYKQSYGVTVTVPKEATGSKQVTNAASKKSKPDRATLSLATDHESVTVSIPSRSDSTVVKYRLYRKTGNNTGSELIKTFYAGDLLVYSDTSVEKGKSYSYSYIIDCTNGELYPESHAASITIPTKHPLADIAYSFSNDNKAVKINIPKSSDQHIRQYTLYRKEGTGTNKKIYKFLRTSVLSYTDRSIEPGKSYTYYYIVHYDNSAQELESAPLTLSVPWGPDTPHNHFSYDYHPTSIKKYVGKEAQVTIPKQYNQEDITRIDEFAFSKNKTIKKVYIPDSITDIDMYAFFECDNLTHVILPSTLNSIGASAFSGCNNLQSVGVIPKNVTHINASAFNGCPKLSLIVYRNSYAESFAKGNHIPYTYID